MVTKIDQKDPHFQTRVAEWVQSHILANQTSLVNVLFRHEELDADNIINNYDYIHKETGEIVNGEALYDAQASENFYKTHLMEDKEVLEWILIDDYLANLLVRRNEAILSFGDNRWWGRTTCGQAVYMDYVIQDIYQETKKRSI